MRRIESARQSNTRSAILGVVTLTVMAASFLFDVGSVLAIPITFLQKDWTTETGNVATTANLTGWSQYLDKDLDLIAGDTLKIEEKLASATDEDFTGGTNSNTRVDGADVKLDRIGNAAGITSINNFSGLKSAIVKDNDGGLHVVYHDDSQKKMYYRYSPNGGASWYPSDIASGGHGILIPVNRLGAGSAGAGHWTNNVLPTEWGYELDLEIDVDTKRLYAAYKARRFTSGTTQDFTAIAVATCSYADPDGPSDPLLSPCADAQSNDHWTSTVVGDFTDDRYQGTMNERYNSPALKISRDASYAAKPKILHLLTTAGGSDMYWNCALSSTVTCVNFVNWTAPRTSNWWQTINTRLVVGPGHRLHVLTQIVSSGGNSFQYRTCRISASVDCIAAAGWNNAGNPTVPVATTIGAGEHFIDGAIVPYLRGGTTPSSSAIGTSVGTDFALHIVYEQSGQLRYRVTPIYQSDTTASIEDFNVPVGTSTDVAVGSIEVKPVRIVMKDNYLPFVIFAAGGQLYTLERLTGAAGTFCTIGAVATQGNWTCRPVELGGIGSAVVLYNGNPTNLLPSITHFGKESAGANTVLRFLATPYQPNGTFTSRKLDALDLATWNSVQVKLAEPLKAGTSFKLSVRTGGASMSNPYCVLFDTAVTGAPAPDANNTYTVSLSTCSVLSTPANQRYLQYQLYLKGNANNTATPIVDWVNATFRRFPNAASLTSSPFQMVTNAAEAPVIRSISWKEVIPAGSSAQVSLQVRAKGSVGFTDTDPWYGAGSAANGKFTTTATTVDGACTRVNDADAGAMTNGKKVVCDVSNQGNAINNTLNSHLQYKVTLGSPAQDDTATVYEVSVTYATNDQPVVTVQTPTQGVNGIVAIPYTLSDGDATHNVGLFYDVGLRLSSSIDQNQSIIAIDQVSGLSVSALLPVGGIVLVDNEQIKYTQVLGNTIRGIAATAGQGRGWVPPSYAGFSPTPNAAAHSAGAVVWVRATDGILASDFGRPAYATGNVGNGQTPGSGKSISWRPSLDINASIYMQGQMLRVVAVDGQLVKSTGGATISSTFTLDTKVPQLGNNPLSIGGAGVFPALGKTNTPSVTLQVSAVDTANDNASGNMMSFCNGNSCGTPSASDLQSGAAGWSSVTSLATAHPWTLTSDQAAPQTIHLAAYDPVGNIVFSSKQIVLDAPPAGNPPPPSSFTVEDISNTNVGALLYIRWSDLSADSRMRDAYGGSDFKKYKIYRSNGTAAASEPPLIEVTNPSATSYVDASVANGQAYTYRLVVEDNVGNVSSPLANAPFGTMTPSTTGAPPPAPPVVTNVQMPQVATTNAITITWDTDIPSDSRVVYASTQLAPVSFDGYPSQGNTVVATSGQDAHSVTLIGLTPSTTYYFEVRSRAPGSNTAGASRSAVPGGATYSFRTADPPPVVKPIISNVQVVPTHNTATVTWTTDIDSDSFVEYGTNSALGVTATYYGQRDDTRNHSVTLGSLQPNMTYYFRVNSTSGTGTGTSPEPPAAPALFQTTLDPRDTTPPQYSNIQVTGIQHNTATITWSTNEPATETVEFWKDGETQTRLWPPVPSNLKTTHSVQLPFDLEPETTYHFYVWSADSSNNSIPSGQSSFVTGLDPNDTTPPSISGLRNDPAGATTVTIYFSTDEPADATILYSVGDQSYGIAQSFPTLTTDHVVTLVNLTPGTQYFYKVRSTNASGYFTDWTSCDIGTCTFTTLASSNDLPQLVAGSIVVSDVTSNQATISWTTTQPGNSMVEFGVSTVDQNGVLVPIYGRTFGKVRENVTDHTVILPNDLLSGEKYYFRVRTRDAFDQLVVYPGTPDPTDTVCAQDPANCKNPSFTTQVSNIILIAEQKTPPVITGVGPLLVTDKKAIIGWTTDKLADSEVSYGTSSTYGIVISDRLPPNGTNPNALTRTHAITIEGLQPKTDYVFKVASSDITDQRSEDDNGGQGFAFKTAAGTSEGDGADGEQQNQPTDLIPPSLSGVAVVDIADTSARVVWSTNEVATSVVQYGETSSYGELSGDYSTFVAEHSVTLTGLRSGTQYHYKAISYDGQGNRGESSDAVFTTSGEPSEEEEEENGEEEEGEGEEDKLGKDELDDITKKIKELSEEKKLSIERIIELLQEFSEEDVANVLASIGVQLVSPPKFIGGNPRVEVTTNSATISWQTDKDADSRVAYVAGEFYKPLADEPYATETGVTQTFSTSHEVTILGLEPNTLYHFQIRSREPAGRSALSQDRTFKTLPLKPEIAGLAVVGTTERTATFAWKTNVPTKTVVDYVKRGTKDALSQGETQLVSTHRFTLTNLEPDTSYAATIRAEDETGLSVVSKAVSFTTSRDGVAPEITQVRTDVTLAPGKSDLSQAIITWKTDEPSSSQVLYEEGISQSDELKNATVLQDELLINHVIVLNKLRPATPYRFRVVSVDGAGNKTVSRDFTLLTPQKKETVLEIIIKNFEQTFGFLKGFGE